MSYDHVPTLSNSHQGGGTSAGWGGDLLVTGAGLDAAGAATKYLTAVGQNHAAAQVVLCVVPEGFTNIHSLYVSLVTAPGGSDTYAVTVQKSTDNGATWSNTALTCTVTGANKSNSDTTNRPTVAAGNLLAIKAVSSAGTAAAATASLVVS